MDKLSDQEIYDNRLKAVEYLMQPGLKKATGVLENINTGGRCCLGHMCVALGVERSEDKLCDPQYRVGFGKVGEHFLAPIELQRLIGLNGSDGEAAIDYPLQPKGMIKRKYFYTLSELNDESRISSQSIGKYLKSVILGGPNTPWIKIDPSKINVKEH